MLHPVKSALAFEETKLFRDATAQLTVSGKGGKDLVGGWGGGGCSVIGWFDTRGRARKSPKLACLSYVCKNVEVVFMNATARA